MIFITNPLPEYLDHEGVQVQIDIELDERSASDPQWLRKVKHRVGAIVVEYNFLERMINDAILEIMNERAEDERVWVFLEGMTSARKIDALSRLYDIYFHRSRINAQLMERKKRLFKELEGLRQRRNVYVHANWLNTVLGELVEHKTKQLKSGGFGRFRQKISLSDLEVDQKLLGQCQNLLADLHEEILEAFFNGLQHEEA